MERLWSVVSDKHEDVCLEFTYLTFSVDKTEIQTANVEFFFIEIHNGRSLLPINFLAASCLTQQSFAVYCKVYKFKSKYITVIC